MLACQRAPNFKVNILGMNKISSSAVVPESAKIGNFVIIEDGVILSDSCVISDFVLIQKNTRIGSNCFLGTYSKIGEGVVIGSDCKMTAYCEVRNNCRLGDRVTMGSRCTLSAGSIVEDDVVMKYSFVLTDTPVLSLNNQKSVGRLGRGSRYGANVTIMPGVTVGINSEIGANSQVRVDVPDHEVWFGVPAKFYKKIPRG